MAPPATIGISPSSFTHAFRDPAPTQTPQTQAVTTAVAQEVSTSQETFTKEKILQAKSAEGPTKYSETFISGPKNFKAEVETQGSETQPAAKYKHYLPTWDAETSGSSSS